MDCVQDCRLDTINGKDLSVSNGMVSNLCTGSTVFSDIINQVDMVEWVKQIFGNFMVLPAGYKNDL